MIPPDAKGPDAPPREALGATVLLVALLSGTVYARACDPDAFNYDVAQVLHFAERMLHGDRLYVDLIDENPPLVFWLSAIVVALAHWIGTTAIVAYDLSIAGASFAAGALAYRLLRVGWPETTPSYSLALVGLLLATELLLPGFDFGQRENLLVVAVAPYLFAAAARAGERPVPRALAIAAGLLAGVGLSLKPHFVVLWLAVEGWLLVASSGRGAADGRAGALRRAIRPESVAIAAVVAAYGVAVAWLAPDYLSVVRASMQLLGAYFEPALPSLLLPPAIVLAVCAAGVAALVRPSAIDRELRRVLVVAMVALSGAAILQGKGWSYHYYPAQAFALVLLGTIALGLVAHGAALGRVLRPNAAVLPLAALVLLSGWSARALVQASYDAFGAGREEPSMTRVLAGLVREHAWSRPIYVMSTSVYPAFPIVNLTNARWASRFCCLWYLAGSYTADEKATTPFPYHDRDEMPELERFALDAVIEDLETHRPELLIVDTNPNKQAFGQTDFRILQYFRRDPRFEAIFSRYRHLADVGAYRVFERVL